MTATAGAAAAMGARSAVTTAPAATTTATTEVAAAVAAALETTENEDAEAAAVGGDLSQVIDRMRGTPLREEEASQYTASYQLLKSWSLAKIENREMDDSISVDVLIPRRTPLLGQDLQLFLQAEEFACLQQQKREEQAAMLREVELAKTSLRLGNDVDIVDMNDEDTNPLLGSVGAGGTAHAVSSSTTSEAAAATTGSSSTIMGSNNDDNHKSTSTTSIPVGVSASASAAGTGGGGVGSHLPFFRRPPKKSRFDSSLFLKFSKPLHLTFELREDAVGIGQRDVIAKFGIGASLERNSTNQVIEDDYGIAVRPEQFCDIVTGVDPSKLGPSGRIGDDVQRRGLGFAAGSSTGPGGAGPSSSSGPNNKNNDHRKSSSGGGGNSSSGKMNHKRPYGKYNNDGNTSNSNNAGGGGGEDHNNLLSRRCVDGTCTLCIDEYVDGDIVVWSDLLCSHVFHKECLMQWLSKGKKRCPVCRHWFVPGAKIDDQKLAHGETWKRALKEMEQREKDEKENKKRLALLSQKGNTLNTHKGINTKSDEFQSDESKEDFTETVSLSSSSLSCNIELRNDESGLTIPHQNSLDSEYTSLSDGSLEISELDTQEITSTKHDAELNTEKSEACIHDEFNQV